MSRLTGADSEVTETVTVKNNVKKEKKKPIYYKDVPLQYYEDLVTEDGEPVESVFHEKQQRLLVDCLTSSWKTDRQFIAMSNVGLFYELNTPPLVPDMLLSLDVTLSGNILLKQNSSYFVWKYGKPPDLVVEIVSNLKGNEKGTKFVKYAEIGISVYVVVDPGNKLKQGFLNVYKLVNDVYAPFKGQWLEEIGLGLTLWNDSYESMVSTWLRWCDRKGVLVPTGKELSQIQWQRAEKEKQRAEQEKQRAEQEKLKVEQEMQKAKQEKQKAELEKERAEKLAAQLRALGIEPEV